VTFDLGDVVPLGTTVEDAAGALANAGNMALTITLPDASTVTAATVAPTSTGTYAYDYATTQAGRHTARWVATGLNAGAYVDVFDVRAAMPPMLFSLAAAKAKLNIPAASTDDDEELREFIEATTQCVEYFVGALVRRTVTQVVSGGRPAVVLHTTPVLTVTSVVGLQSSQEAVDVAVLDAAGDTGVVWRTDGLAFPVGSYRWTYTVGRTAVPANVSLAAKLILQHMWRTQRAGRRGGLPGGGDDYSVTEPIPGLGYAVPNRALELLGADRLPPGMA
jgi:hypothetical protein